MSDGVKVYRFEDGSLTNTDSFGAETSAWDITRGSVVVSTGNDTGAGIYGYEDPSVPEFRTYVYFFTILALMAIAYKPYVKFSKGVVKA